MRTRAVMDYMQYCVELALIIAGTNCQVNVDKRWPLAVIDPAEGKAGTIHLVGGTSLQVRRVEKERPLPYMPA